MGELFTVADPYLFTLAGWLEGDGVDIGLFPRVQAHYRRMQARPAVRKVLAEMAA
jgi:glutathione S-transferase